MRLLATLTCCYNPQRVTVAARSMPRPMARRLAVGCSPTTGPPLLRCLAGDAETARDLGPGVPGSAQADHDLADGLVQLAGRAPVGELAGLQAGDRVSVPGPGLRLRRTVLASEGGGALYVDTLKNNRSRTVPLVLDLVPIVDRWRAGKAPDGWLFSAPGDGPLRESNWKRSVGWSAATATAGLQGFRVHDLRHTAASV